MIFKYKNLPAWQKVLFFPFWILGWVFKIAWVIASGIAALTGTIAGQVVRLAAIVVYFLWMWAYTGWLEGQGMAARGEADRRKALEAELDKAKQAGVAEGLAAANKEG